MSNGEVKRYIPDSTTIYLSGESTPEPTTCVVLGRDHERIVAELRAEVERLKRERAKYEADCKRIEYFDDLHEKVATQARVIEKLKQAHEKNANEDLRGNRSTESIRSFKVLKEVEAIEKGES